jgi:hypothetical protein
MVSPFQRIQSSFHSYSTARQNNDSSQDSASSSAETEFLTRGGGLRTKLRSLAASLDFKPCRDHCTTRCIIPYKRKGISPQAQSTCKVPSHRDIHSRGNACLTAFTSDLHHLSRHSSIFCSSNPCQPSPPQTLIVRCAAAGNGHPKAALSNQSLACSETSAPLLLAASPKCDFPRFAGTSPYAKVHFADSSRQAINHVAGCAFVQQ